MQIYEKTLAFNITSQICCVKTQCQTVLVLNGGKCSPNGDFKLKRPNMEFS